MTVTFPECPVVFDKVRLPLPFFEKPSPPEIGEVMVMLLFPLISKIGVPESTTLERVPFPPRVAEFTKIEADEEASIMRVP